VARRVALLVAPRRALAEAMMQAISDYLTMGGYAAFIWPAYGVAALVLIAFAIDSWLRVKRAEAALRRLEAELPGRKAGKVDDKAGGKATDKTGQSTVRP
jgi:heme exporter protein D